MGAIAGANMWALLLDKDPGNSAAAADLAVDVVDQKLKKAAMAVTVKVEEAPLACNVVKPAKRGDKSKKMKKVTTGNSKQAAAFDCHRRQRRQDEDQQAGRRRGGPR